MNESDMVARRGKESVYEAVASVIRQVSVSAHCHQFMIDSKHKTFSNLFPQIAGMRLKDKVTNAAFNKILQSNSHDLKLARTRRQSFVR